VACGAELGVGRFCLNCGHRIGAPAPVRDEPAAAPAPATRTAAAPPGDLPAAAAEAPAAAGATAVPDAPAGTGAGTAASAGAGTVVDDARGQDTPAATVVPPVQAADPTPVPPTVAPDVVPDDTDRPPSPRPAWDPREDLLPYEEVDDVDGDLPVRGMAWIGWVVGAALLVGLAFLLLRVLEPDGDEVAADPSGDASTSSQASEPAAEPSDDGGEESAGVGKARDLSRGATFEVPGTAPPTTDFDGNLVAYEASQMGDRIPATAWRTAGDATGATVTVALTEPGVVTRVGLINGYAKQVAGVDWYPHNRRILSVTWGFDDGSTVEQSFAERPRMQWLKVPPVETGTVTLTINAVTPPGLGSLGRDYTAISEVGVMGRRAG